MINSKNKMSLEPICCFCSESQTLNNYQTHLLKCKNNFEHEINEKITLPMEYEDLFTKIKEDYFAIPSSSKGKLLEFFNSEALQQFGEYKTMKIIYENSSIYYKKLYSISKDVIESNMGSELYKKIQECYSIAGKRETLETRAKINEVFCFVCGREIHFWNYDQHAENCYKSPKFEDNKYFKKPNFNIIKEVIKEFQDLQIDFDYVRFLIKEYNKECEKIYKEYFSNVKLTTARRPARARYTSSIITPDSQIIFQRKLDNDISTKLENEKHKLMLELPKSIRCFLCGDYSPLDGFESHYIKCKNSIQFKLAPEENKKFVEFLNKIVIGNASIEDVEDYKKFSEKTFWELVCKVCNNCNLKFNPLAYEKHVKLCIDQSNFPYISFHR
jgi:hypothetical protein